MSKKDQENIKEEEEVFSVNTTDGKLKVSKSFFCKAENRILSFLYLEDETTIINVERFEESETAPYTEHITNQTMRLSKLTVSMLLVCLLKANDDFGIEADELIEEFNKKNSNENK